MRIARKWHFLGGVLGLLFFVVDTAYLASAAVQVFGGLGNTLDARLGQAVVVLLVMVMGPGLAALFLVSSFLVDESLDRGRLPDDWCPVCQGYVERGLLEEHMRGEHPGPPGG